MEEATAYGHLFHDPVAFAMNDNKWREKAPDKIACTQKCRSITYSREDGDKGENLQTLLVKQGRKAHFENWNSLVKSGEVAEGGLLTYKRRRGRLVYVETELCIQEISPSRGMESTEIEAREGNDAPLEEPHNGGRSGTKRAADRPASINSNTSGAEEAAAAENEDGDVAEVGHVKCQYCEKIYKGKAKEAHLARHRMGCLSRPRPPSGGSGDRFTAREDDSRSVGSEQGGVAPEATPAEEDNVRTTHARARSPCKLDAGSGTEAAAPQLTLPAPQPASAMAPSLAEAARASADAEERGEHDWTRKANQALDALMKTRKGRKYFNEPVRAAPVVSVCVQTNSSPHCS